MMFVQPHTSPLHRTHNMAAQSAGGIPFASSSLPGLCPEPGPHTGTAPDVAGPRCWNNVNDGVRADERGWAPGAPHGGRRFVGIRLAGAAPVQYVAWGRDATGRFPKGGWEGVVFTLQYTADPLSPLPPGDLSDVTWQDAVAWQDYAGAFTLASAATHVFELRPPVPMTAMRLVVSSALATVDEVGLYLQRDAAAAYDSAVDVCVPDPRADRMDVPGLSINATVRLTALDPTAGPGLSAYVRGASFADKGDFVVGFGASGRSARLGLAVRGNAPEAVWFDYAFQIGVEYAIDLHYAVAGASARLLVNGEQIQTLRYDSTAGVVGIAGGWIGCAADGTGRLRGVIGSLMVVDSGVDAASSDETCDGSETVLEIVTKDFAAEVGWALVGVKPPYRMFSQTYQDNTVNRVEFCLPGGDYIFYATDSVCCGPPSFFFRMRPIAIPEIQLHS